MIEKCTVHKRETTVTPRQAHKKKMVRNEDALQSAFEHQKLSGLVFLFFGFGAIAAYGPQTRKKRVRIHFMKTWFGRFTRPKYLVRTNFLWVGTHFFL